VLYWQPSQAAAAGDSTSERRLDERDVGDEPVAPLIKWLNEATEAAEPLPNAMALATTSASGAPAVRMVLLDRLDERGCVFQTNVESPKAFDLAARPWAGLAFFWPRLLRQVRVTGPVTRLSVDEVQRLFEATPPGIQAMLRACRQSRAIANREELEQRYAAAVLETAGGKPLPMPSDWGGFRVGLETVEFWQGRPNRLQDRLRFSRTTDGWRLERLMP
jgi:pyridoxamine 5'-phosphate oxidase